jgi:hypothetical protein
MKIQFVAPKGCGCRSFMREIYEQVNVYRRTLGLRAMAKNTFYKVRQRAAEAWLDERIRKYPRSPDKWRGNPFLANDRNGGYVFSQRNSNALLAVAVQYKLSKPRGLPAVKLQRATAKRRKLLAA